MTDARLFARGAWHVPDDVIDAGDRIEWRGISWTARERSTLDRLGGFFSLARNSHYIRTFVRANGLLGICEHDRPFRHGLLDGRPACALVRDERSGSESVAGWRWVNASMARALRLSDQVRARPDNTELFDRLTKVVDDWMILADVRPKVSRPGIVIAFDGAGLLGDLAIQLLHAIASVSNSETCDACGKLFPARRRRVKGQRLFCSDCGRSAALRLASRDYRIANAPYVQERDRERKRLERARAKSEVSRR